MSKQEPIVFNINTMVHTSKEANAAKKGLKEIAKAAERKFVKKPKIKKNKKNGMYFVFGRLEL